MVLMLAEGSGKPSQAERKRFYGIALGSIREIQSILDLTNQQELFKRADEVGAMTFRLMQSSC